MNPFVKAAIKGVARTFGAYLASKAINVDNDMLELTLETLVVLAIAGWSVYDKKQTDRKIEKAAATGEV